MKKLISTWLPTAQVIHQYMRVKQRIATQLLRVVILSAWEHGHPVRFQAGVSLEQSLKSKTYSGINPPECGQDVRAPSKKYVLSRFPDG